MSAICQVLWVIYPIYSLSLVCFVSRLDSVHYRFSRYLKMDILAQLRMYKFATLRYMKDGTLIVFTYALAGLGHLRVARALYKGRPEGVPTTFLVSPDASVSSVHRIMSTHRLGRSFMEWLQHGSPEALFTSAYLHILRSNTKLFKIELDQILARYSPKQLVFVSTHFGLGHQLEAMRDYVQKTRGIPVFHSVVVTDDSPQRVWNVKGADIIFVPSESTKKILTAYAGSSAGRYEVIPYPVDPDFSAELSAVQFSNRVQQSRLVSGFPVHISIPVSGAAVNTSTTYDFIANLNSLSDSFRFHIVCRQVPYTATFLKHINELANVSVYSSNLDVEIVDMYEQLFHQGTVSFEVTKPSEQAFKALLPSTVRGGVLILFTEPVGRQERDNLAFFKRHSLIPPQEIQERLWQYADVGHVLEGESPLYSMATSWRGLCIPEDPKRAAKFLLWCFRSHLFAAMTTNRTTPVLNDPNLHELGGWGVQKFWEILNSSLQ